MIAALHMQHFMKVANQANPISTTTTEVPHSQMPFLNQQTVSSPSQFAQPNYGLHELQRKNKMAAPLRV